MASAQSRLNPEVGPERVTVLIASCAGSGRVEPDGLWRTRKDHGTMGPGVEGCKADDEDQVRAEDEPKGQGWTSSSVAEDGILGGFLPVERRDSNLVVAIIAEGHQVRVLD